MSQNIPVLTFVEMAISILNTQCIMYTHEIKRWGTSFLGAFLLLTAFSSNINAQVGIGTNTPNASAILDLTATDKGFLPPRMTSAQRSAITSPATGLLVYQTDATIGLYQYNGSSWAMVLLSTDAWKSNGNAGTSAASNFIGTTDAIDFIAKTNNSERMRITSAGNIGINTTPGSTLDVKGTFRLSGSTSGYVGFSPAAAAGSTTYTLPGTDGTNGYQLTTNGSGILSWAAAGAASGWNLTGNSGTSAASNFIGTTDGIDFITKTNNSERMRITSAGNVGINTTPGSTLDVKGTFRLSGSSSGYVGFAPAASAGSTTYTLPSSDGTNGYQLTTNGSGTLSWSAAGSGASGWGLTGNSGTSAGTNFIGTTDNQPLMIKVYNTTAGYIGTSSDYNTFLGYNTNYSGGGTYNVGIGNGATIYGNITKSIAIGNAAQVQPGSGSTDNIAIGSTANVTGGSAYSYSIALGSSALVQNSNGMAIGKSSSVNSQYGMAIGDGAQAQAVSALVIGQNAYANGTNSIAIGSGSSGSTTQAQGANCISLGTYCYTSNTDAIAIGNHAQAQATNSLSLGSGLYNGSSNTYAIGNSSVTSVLLNGASASSGKAFIVGNSSSNGNGAYLTTGGTWTNASDKNLKENITPIDGREVLAKLSNLDISRWKYKGTDEYHVGPMAQDFYEMFGLGDDDKHISTLDPSGLALLSIKTLKQENDALNSKNQSLEKKLDDQLLLIKALQKQMNEVLKSAK